MNITLKNKVGPLNTDDVFALSTLFNNYQLQCRDEKLIENGLFHDKETGVYYLLFDSGIILSSSPQIDKEGVIWAKRENGLLYVFPTYKDLLFNKQARNYRFN